MRRHYIWYCLAVGWGIAAVIGFLRHHGPQAVPALIFAILFAVLGIGIGKRDDALRKQRTPKFR
jgi:hypothetical protein